MARATTACASTTACRSWPKRSPSPASRPAHSWAPFRSIADSGSTRGFQTYGDRMPRTAGAVANERPGHAVVDEAIGWLRGLGTARFFLWVHLFEPHAPYGLPGDARPVEARYDDEIAEADRQVGRLIDALGEAARETLIVVAADHGEAFGEHGEIAHSIFVYDTTLRVPLIVAGPGDRGPQSSRRRRCRWSTSRQRWPGWADSVRSTPTAWICRPRCTADRSSDRRLYAESFAPLLDFGWSPLRSVRQDGWKVDRRAATRAVSGLGDPAEKRDCPRGDGTRSTALRETVRSIFVSHACRTAGAPIARAPRGCRRWDMSAPGDPARSPAPIRRIAVQLAARHRARHVRRTARQGAGARAPRASSRPIPAIRRRTCGSGSCCPSRDAAPRRCHSSRPRSPTGSRARIRTWGLRGVMRSRASSTLRPPSCAPPIARSPTTRWSSRISASCCRTAAGRLTGIAPLNRALAIDPDFHEARFNLAIAYARAGNEPRRRARPRSCCGGCRPTRRNAREVERLLARGPVEAGSSQSHDSSTGHSRSRIGAQISWSSSSRWSLTSSSEFSTFST